MFRWTRKRLHIQICEFVFFFQQATSFIKLKITSLRLTTDQFCSKSQRLLFQMPCTVRRSTYTSAGFSASIHLAGERTLSWWAEAKKTQKDHDEWKCMMRQKHQILTSLLMVMEWWWRRPNCFIKCNQIIICTEVEYQHSEINGFSPSNFHVRQLSYRFSQWLLTDLDFDLYPDVISPADILRQQIKHNLV